MSEMAGIEKPVTAATVPVCLGRDFWAGEFWMDAGAVGTEQAGAAARFEIPRETYDRWCMARAAYEAMQREIGEYLRARDRATWDELGLGGRLGMPAPPQ